MISNVLYELKKSSVILFSVKSLLSQSTFHSTSNRVLFISIFPFLFPKQNYCFRLYIHDIGNIVVTLYHTAINQKLKKCKTKL